MKTIIVKGKPVTFARYGGLSSVKQNGYNPRMETFHSPPTRKGFYAYVFPYIELFLLSGFTENQNKVKENNEGNWKLHRPRKFEYHGNLWHHLSTIKAIKRKGSWVLTTYEDYCEALDNELHNLMKATNAESKGGLIRSGNTGYFAKDHLEVYIPASGRYS